MHCEYAQQGTYTLTNGATADSSVIESQRLTGDKKYTDKLKFTLKASGSGCELTACSESQVMSVIDFSTNYCNLHDLYCGSQDGCPTAKMDLKYSEKLNSCKQHDKSKCIATSLVDDKKCKTVTTAQNFDLDQYIQSRWYIQQQMEVSYLPKSQNQCVSAKYKKQKPTLFGYTIDVLNLAYESDKSTKHQGNLCASQDGSDDPAKLEVAPCFLPKLASGPYWVLAFDNTEGYALVSGGQPTIATENGLCKTGSGVNGAGLWVFTRQQARNQTLVDKVRGIALDKGFDLSVLNDVDQTGCPAPPSGEASAEL